MQNDLIQRLPSDVCVYFWPNRYEYLRREGNFERSAGLQIGVDTIEVRATNTQRDTMTICELAEKKPAH